ncbi:DUF3892 domain-containing protein [Curtobacterium flaccumfaciens]|uniref:DUF3892 domain-containing protein n=1 Tax=Curtobacterium flaccumfaciens TaxID=2035 RepID=UPI001BDE6E0F|nr:DUF3892 domain-containing protein [Curtobacterium flaccumfaciens]MBT1631033.1 DUF3892 domain-containing protein [Curtobacterium flaccumfaciens pv. oortii]MCS5493267.1 DUF3892 domain-containing protein [Curtobacterium flaccumfaciens pv. flaccumfaciens]MCX2845081.1 DUF3892 domain-containing protein [Curtobacterium flaccumfaciens pv. oortii]
MTIRITHIRLSGGIRDHHHITDVRRVGCESGKLQDNAVAQILEWIDGGARLRAGAGAGEVPVGVVSKTGHRPYLRSHADGTWNNNVLAQPRSEHYD